MTIGLVRLHFYGTKGYVEESSRAHAGHSAFTIEADGFRLLCDFGENRKGLLEKIRPDAVFVSHAHPDHSWGLEEGASAAVYASEITHSLTEKFPIEKRVVLEPGKRVRMGPFRLTAFPVVHSVRCPCIAARLEISGRALVYSGDIVSFENPERTLSGADVYIGDGSTLKGSLVRRHPSGTLIGHTTVRAQLGWLEKYGIRRAVFSHFGKGPIEMGEEALAEALGKLVSERFPDCEVTPASDGMAIEI
jgi:ribonuclease BN (tRNA processing enzyme)